MPKTIHSQLLLLRASLSSHLDDHPEYDSLDLVDSRRETLRRARDAMSRAVDARTMFEVFDNLDTLLAELGATRLDSV